MTNPIRVLHVDDESGFAEMAAEFLEREDDRIEVLTATSAPAGLGVLRENDVDCVVSDYDMPETNGVAFLETVREDYPQLPFVLFTGKGSEEVASEAISAGATDYLQKEGGTDQYTILANRVSNYVDTADAKTQRQRQLDAIEAAQEGISILGDDGRFIYANEAYADLYGYDVEDLVGRHWEEMYPDDEIPFAQEEMLPAVHEHGKWRGKTTGLRADGTTFVEDHTLATTDRGELVCTVRDVTDRKERGQALAALHEAATDLEAADSPDAVYDILVEASEQILDFDLVAVDILHDDVLVQEAWSLDLDTEGYYQETALDDDTFATRAFHRQETILVDDLAAYDITPADPEYRSALTVPIAGIGTFQTVSREESAFDDVDRELAELLAGHGREALTRLETEQELRERTTELERQNERLEEFAGIVSHDLRTPLSVAEGRLELARQDGNDGHLEEVSGALDRISSIIDETLTLARQGQLVTERERVSIPSLARRCWSRVAVDGATLDVADEGAVRGDPDRLKRVFENLFRNAVEHSSTSPASASPREDAAGTSSGEPSVTDAPEDAVEHSSTSPASQARQDAVEHSSTNPRSQARQDAVEHSSTNPRSQAHEDTLEHGGLVVRVGTTPEGFFVADDGPGIPPAEREQVFERGYTASENGTGFGLSIVLEIVNAHGWDVEVGESETGGARFDVTGVETAD